MIEVYLASESKFSYYIWYILNNIQEIIFYWDVTLMFLVYSVYNHSTFNIEYWMLA